MNDIYIERLDKEHLWSVLTVVFSDRAPVTLSCTRLWTPSAALSRNWERNLQLFTCPTVTSTATTRPNRYIYFILNTINFREQSSKRPHIALLYSSVSHLWLDHRLAAGVSPPGTGRGSQDRMTCMGTRTAIRKSTSEEQTRRLVQKHVT